MCVYNTSRGDDELNEFEIDYRLSVQVEAEYIFDDIKKTAHAKDLEPDIFFEDVIKAARKLVRKEE